MEFIQNFILLAILVRSTVCEALEITAVPKDNAVSIGKARELVLQFLNATENEFVPGLVIGVSVAGEQIWTEGFGLDNIENNVPMKSNAVIQAGSISKSFVAGLAAQLVEDGKLDFDVPIRTYLTHDEFPDKEWNGKVVNVTLRQLLQMTAGIPNGPTSALEIGKCLRCLKQKDRLVLMRDKELEFEPETMFLYSNLGYELAGAVIESVIGNMTFDTAMTDMIRNVLKLNTTAIVNTQLITPNLASFYLTDTKEVYNSGMWNDIFLNDFHAAGGIISTIGDMLSYGQTWLDAFYGRREHFLKQSTLKDVWKPSDVTSNGQLPYGMGWVIQKGTSNRPSGNLVVWHNGATLGCRSVLAIYPESEIIVTASVNLAQSSIDNFVLDGRIANLFSTNGTVGNKLSTSQIQIENDRAYKEPKYINEYLNILQLYPIRP